MPELYRVTNMGDRPLTQTWLKTLLSEEERKDYEEWKTTPEYVGISEEDIVARKKIAEAIKARPYFARLGRDVLMPITDKISMGGSDRPQAISSLRYEWRWCIGPNIEEFIKIIKEGEETKTQRYTLKLRNYLQEYGIKFDLRDSFSNLLRKYVEKFGKNVKVLEKTQWEESGLKELERKEIELMPKPGVAGIKIIYSGLLVAEPITEEEAEEINNNRLTGLEDVEKYDTTHTTSTAKKK